MKERISILFLSALLLIAVSYAQVFHEILNDQYFSVKVSIDPNADAEEGSEKSNEENTRETDQDEDPFNLGEMMMTSAVNSLVENKNENYSFGLWGFYPEIVSPPPQV
jgi:hypothetical protein